MKRFAALFLLGLALSVPLPAAAVPILLDFEGIPSMTMVPGYPVPTEAQLSDRYLLTYGVRFYSVNDYIAVVNLGLGHGTSGINGVIGADGGLNSGTVPVRAKFFMPGSPTTRAVTDFVSVRADYAGGNGPLTITAYDVSGAAIASSTVADSGGATLAVSVSGIHSVAVSNNCCVGFDDFQFNPVTPAPAAPPAPIVINFDDLTAALTFNAGDAVRESARLSTGYLNTLGVRFESIGTKPYVAVVPLGNGHACSNYNGIAAVDASDLIQGLFPIGVSFLVPSTATQKQKAVTNYVAMKGDGWGSGATNTINAYDVNGNLIVSTVFADTGCNLNFVSAPGIHSVRFIGNGSVGYDDLVFNPLVGVNSLTFQGVTFTTTLVGNVLEVEIDAAAPTGDWASAKYIDAIEVKNIGTYSSFTMSGSGSGWAATKANLNANGCTPAGKKGGSGGACAQGNAQQLADDMHFTFTFDANATLNGAAPSLAVRFLNTKMKKLGSMLGQPIPPLVEPAP